MIEVLLEKQSYADISSMLQRYDENAHQSTAVIYTNALLKIRQICGEGNTLFRQSNCQLLVTQTKLTEAERIAIEAIHAAVEYNPHVPLYLLEQRPLILPGEHILRRGDSDAIAYAFWHLRHWKKIPGALTFLNYTWQDAFKHLPHHIDRGFKFVAYPARNDEHDRMILPVGQPNGQIHKQSIYPRRLECPLLDLPFFIILTFMLFIITGIVAGLFHYYPEYTFQFLMHWFGKPFEYVYSICNYGIKLWVRIMNINISLVNKIFRFD